MKKLKETESETKDLRTMTRRMILSKEEMVNFLIRLPFVPKMQSSLGVYLLVEVLISII